MPLFLNRFLTTCFLLIMLLTVHGSTYGQNSGEKKPGTGPVSGKVDSTPFLKSTLGKQGIKIETEKGYVVVQALYDGMIHVETSAKGAAPDVEQPLFKSLLVDQKRFPGPSLFVAQDDGFSTAKLRVEIDSATLCVAIANLDEKTPFNTICPEALKQPTKFLRFKPHNPINLYGLGQYISDPLILNSDWIGKTWEPGPFGNFMRGFRRGATANTQMPIMYVLGENKDNHSIFFDNIYRQRWDFTQKTWTVETWGDQLRYFVFTADDLQHLRKTYMNLTGKPPIPRKQVFGMWASEFGYDNWQEVYTNINSLKEFNYPLDGLSLDLQWYGTKFNDPDKSTMGSLRWDQKNFPDPEKHVDNIKNKLGLQLVLIEQPYISAAIPEHQILDARGFMVKDCAHCGSTFITYSTWWGRGGMLDFTNPVANQYWHSEKRRKLIDIGIYGHWTDLGEPEMYHPHAWYYGFPVQNLHQHGDVHNIYNWKWVEGIYQGYLDDEINERPIILTRSGNAGVQKFGVAMWSGDIGANLDSMQAQMNSQAQISMSGIDYYGSDVGGFYRRSGDGFEDQLYSMWFANASMFEVPVRVHVWNLDNKNSSLPSVRGDHPSNLKNIRRRYSLLPYYYSLAHRAFESGDPLLAPLVYYWQEDMNARTITDQKTVGPFLMGGLANSYGQIARDVYLPKGTWYDYESGAEIVSQGEWLKHEPMYRHNALTLPLYATAGAILPKMRVPGKFMNAHGRTLEGKTDSTLVIEVFKGPSLPFEFYEDDGQSFDYTRGAFRTTQLTQTLISDQEVRIGIEGSKGEYPGGVSKRPYLIEYRGGEQRVKSATINNQALPVCNDTMLALYHSGESLENEQACIADLPERKTSMIYLGVFDINVDKTVVIDLEMRTQQMTGGILLACENAKTTPGTSVYALGNIPQLGAGDIDKALKLSPMTYPSWFRYIEELPVGTKIEWACIKKSDGSIKDKVQEKPQMQPGGKNSVVISGNDKNLSVGKF